MRSTLVFGLLFMLFAVPAAQSQQAPAPARDEQPAPPVVEPPLSTQQADTARVAESKEKVVEVAARREMSARSLLAIVGGVVVAVALIVLLK